MKTAILNNPKSPSSVPQEKEEEKRKKENLLKVRKVKILQRFRLTEYFQQIVLLY